MKKMFKIKKNKKIDLGHHFRRSADREVTQQQQSGDGGCGNVHGSGGTDRVTTVRGRGVPGRW